MCKTAIKLLLVFVEYTDTNCLLLIKAINEVDKELGVIPWSNIITTIQNANKDSSKRIGNYIVTVAKKVNWPKIMLLMKNPQFFSQSS